MTNTIRAAAVAAAMLATSALADPAGVRLVRVDPTGAAGTRRVAGTIVAAERATIATRIPASVIEVRVREGARVERGQVLVRLSDQDLRGALAASQTSLDVARTHEKRIRSLLQQQAATQVELDQAVAQRAQAEAAVSAARTNLAYAELRAPFAGVVQAKRVNAGDLVGPGQPLLDLEGSGGLEVQATVAEREAAGLRTGTRLAFTSGGARGIARVTALAPGGDPVSHRIALRALVVDGAEHLRSGTFVRLEIPSSDRAAEAAVWIPRSAVVERGDLTGVFVVDGDRARLRWLSVGEVDGEVVAVRSGLRAGETIVDEPGAMRDGAPIAPAAGVR
ncbi:MAG TPA: efflux RND transporter periplasmic adaptor subunit [Anaeromyxobacteraceae bacterium]|nr:efflux RND transporter periplasmic adaptor subunit [Anaeromyxobacteraceae bacterium]